MVVGAFLHPVEALEEEEAVACEEESWTVLKQNPAWGAGPWGQTWMQIARKTATEKKIIMVKLFIAQSCAYLLCVLIPMCPKLLCIFVNFTTGYLKMINQVLQKPQYFFTHCYLKSNSLIRLGSEQQVLPLLVRRFHSLLIGCHETMTRNDVVHNFRIINLIIVEIQKWQ